MGKRRRLAKPSPPEPKPVPVEGQRALSLRWLGLLAVVGLGAVLLYFYWSRRTVEEVDLGEDPAEDPRITYTGPFRNVHPDVKYVGDVACASCHREIHKGFRQHAMGHSMADIAAVATQQKYDA